MNGVKATTVKLEAQTWRGFGREAQWTATALGVVSGHGATMGAARDDLAERMSDLLRNASVRPAVVIDDDGALRFFYAEGSGYGSMRVLDGRMTGSSYGEGSPDAAAEAVVEYHPGARRIA